MATDGLFNTTISLLGRSLDLRAENHNRISANIANSETPGYVPTGLSFDKELQEAVRSRKQGQDATQVAAHPRHIPLKGSLMTLEQVTGTILED